MAFIRLLITSIVVAVIGLPLWCRAELPNADNRPFWTQKTCYREGLMIFGVGVAMGEKSLESARQKSFGYALWEIANFAQLTDTTLLLVETQMTFTEKNPDSTYTVWRLVKIPLAMLENTKRAMQRNTLFYEKMVDRVTDLEQDLKNELAEELRRAVANGSEENDLKEAFFPELKAARKEEVSHPPKVSDTLLPMAEIDGIHPNYWSKDIVNIRIQVSDNIKLQVVSFSIPRSHIHRRWNTDLKLFKKNLYFKAAALSPGENNYLLKAVDAAGNYSIKKGKFSIDDLHDELRQFLLEE